MSENLAKGLPTKAERIRNELAMAVNYFGVAFSHLANAEDISRGEPHELDADLKRFADGISLVLKGSEGNPGLIQISEEFKAKIKAEESK
jgi:hypothetical protein